MIYDLRLAAACGFILMLCLIGCGRDGLKEISGTVTYDGQSVQKGTVIFLPADGNGPTAAGIIADGKYSAKVMPGPKQVQIEGFRVIGRRRYAGDGSPMMDILEPILPERYNAKTELTCEITPTVPTYDFALEKSPAKRP